MQRRSSRLAAYGLLAASLVGCRVASEETEIIVAFDAADGLRERVARIHVDILDDQAAPRGEADFDLADPAAELPLFALRLIPTGGNADRRWGVVATAFDRDGATLGEQRVEGTYVAGEVREVWVVFDQECEGAACPDGYRCQLGECVERCVEGTVPDGVRRSAPAACADPCDGPVCEGEIIARCDRGARVVERECRLGCADPTACQEVVASNLDEVVGAPSAELGDMVIEDGYTYMLGDGAISDGVRDAGDLSNGIRWRVVEVAGQRYEVFEMRNLLIRPGSTFSLTQGRPFIFLVHGEAIVEGRIQASARAGGAPPSAGDGGGPGGGGAGARAPSGFGGGGGGGFGSSGGAGGDGDVDAPGGAGGGVYGTPELIPLVAGSAGGGGAGGALGGAGGGAVQITARTRIVVRGGGSIEARGGPGEVIEGAAGGGGGSGGAVLLEAPRIELAQSDEARIIAAGRGGARGRDAAGATIEGGRGGDSSAPGGDGESGLEAGGGGGGAGRVRVNNADGDGRTSYEGLVEPTGASVFTVGRVQGGPPR